MLNRNRTSFLRRIGLTAIAATVASLAMGSIAQAEVRVSPNYRLSSDQAPFRGQDQVAFAVNPSNPNHVVEINANYLDNTCEATSSLDGGSTWSPAFTLPNPGALNFIQGCTNTVGLSPYIEFGSNGTVYTVATQQVRNIGGFPENPSALLFKSTNGGQTWQPGVVAMQGSVSGSNPNIAPGPAWYRPSLSVDRGAGAGNADRIVLVARDLRTVEGGDCPTAQNPSFNPCTSATKAAVSNDGGQTWAAPLLVHPPSTNTSDFPSKPVINPTTHAISVAYRTAGTGGNGAIQLARSTDGGLTWAPPVHVKNVTNTGTSVQTHVQSNPLTGQSNSGTYPRMEGNAAGHLFIVYSQAKRLQGGAPYTGADHFISPDSNVYVTRSTDNGANWSAPQKVSEEANYPADDFPGSRVHQTRHPTISVSPNGRINIVWHDRRHWYQGPGERTCTHSHIFCEDIRLGDTYYSYSTDGGTTFADPIRVSDRSRNNEVGYDTRPSGYWWFGPQSATVAGDKVLVGWMDSRVGNWDTDTDDIFLAKVDFNASGTAPKTHVNQGDAVSRSVALSKLGYQGGNEGALIGGPRDPAGAGPTGPATRNASAVVIANQTDTAGALAGTVLGRANPAPVLLSPAAGLPASVKSEVTRLAPAGAYVIGNTGKLSAQVVADLTAAGVPNSQITRIDGASDAAIAASIADRLDARTPAQETANLPAFDAVVIANPASPDSAAAAGLAAARRLPILYVNANAPIPTETQDALTALDIDKTIVVGDTSDVSAAVASALPGATRRGGASVYDTSREVVAESKARGLPSNVVYVADGSKPMDAVLLGGTVARATGMLVLAPAPLHATSAGQASAFNVSGISRFFALGPPASAPPAPKPPAPKPGPGGGATDTTPPVIKLSGSRRQKLGRRVTVTVSCTSEPCTATVGGRIKVPKVGKVRSKTYKLKSKSGKIAKGAKRKYSLTISRKARSAIKRALRRRKRVSAKLTIAAADTAKNTRRAGRTVRFRR